MLVISIGKIQVGCHIYINPPYKIMKSVLLDTPRITLQLAVIRILLNQTEPV